MAVRKERESRWNRSKINDEKEGLEVDAVNYTRFVCLRPSRNPKVLVHSTTGYQQEQKSLNTPDSCLPAFCPLFCLAVFFRRSRGLASPDGDQSIQTAHILEIRTRLPSAILRHVPPPYVSIFHHANATAQSDNCRSPHLLAADGVDSTREHPVSH